MFIGHFGVGFGAKKYATGISLGMLFLAAQFLDLLWPTLLLLDIEHVSISPGITKLTPLDFYDYPVSHSLMVVIGWGILFGLLFWLVTKKTKYAIIIVVCVISHWFLDMLMHRPDLPLMPGHSTKVGLGLWNHPLAAHLIEGLVFTAGVFIYYKTTFPKNKFGQFGLMGLVVLLIIIQITNMAGPVPPGVTAIAVAGQLQWLFVILAFFVDKNRNTH